MSTDLVPYVEPPRAQRYADRSPLPLRLLARLPYDWAISTAAVCSVAFTVGFIIGAIVGR